MRDCSEVLGGARKSWRRLAVNFCEYEGLVAERNPAYESLGDSILFEPFFFEAPHANSTDWYYCLFTESCEK
jgi:hypothetical protein